MSDKNAPVQWTLRVSAGGLYRTIQDENGAIIMQVITHTFRAPEKLDDWQLIAAAPETAAERDRLREVNAELLAPLRAMLSVVGCGTASDCSVCNSARAAIAKAEGKS
jgi:hypothetical protein